MSTVPVFDSPDDFVAFATDKDQLIDRLSALRSQFEQFGTEPCYIVRNPGRVNLIGEHVDYMGFPVLPMALEADCLVCIGPHPNGVGHISIEHLESEQFEALALEATQASDITIDPKEHKWTNYVLAGIKGVLEKEGPFPEGAAMVVHGVVPLSAGVSSSSALVCASALASSALLGSQLGKTDLAELCRVAEQYVGTAGGGMDQAISFLAEEGVAQRISFNPLEATPVPLPEGGVFVVANSLVEASKAETAHKQFNKRVVECRLACAVIAQSLLSNKTTLATYLATNKPKHTVRGLLETYGEAATVQEFGDAALKFLHSAPYTAAEIAKALGTTVEQLRKEYLEVGGREVEEPFLLFERFTHVVSEAARTEQFRQCCANTKLPPNTRLETLGRLMNESHTSLSTLYDCSCEELDRLTQICRDNGAFGSRLTGAGWGGCTVSLVPADLVDDFLDNVWDQYYADEPSRAQHAREVVLFASKAGPGAMVWSLIDE